MPQLDVAWHTKVDSRSPNIQSYLDRSYLLRLLIIPTNWENQLLLAALRFAIASQPAARTDNRPKKITGDRTLQVSPAKVEFQLTDIQSAASARKYKKLC